MDTQPFDKHHEPQEQLGPGQVHKYSRHDNRKAGLCFNGGASHGKATHGILCYPCRLIHRGKARTIAEARELAAAEGAK